VDLFGTNIGYFHFLIFLFIASGVLIFCIDVKIYELFDMQKEKRVAKFLGGFNISLGLLLWIAA